jgi:hypothetical protein
VYPNITTQKADNANLHVDPQEVAIAELEASPFSRVCRVYAPMYREATDRASGAAAARSGEVAYASVLNAWQDYLAHYNEARGVVLIGHSEGAYELEQLIVAQIDRNPGVHRLLVSAILTGGNVPLYSNIVPGPYINTPACTRADQTGCVIGYDSYSELPPPDSLFGRPPSGLSGAATVRGILCTNPAALGGGSGTLISLYRRQLPVQVPGSLADGIFGRHAPAGSQKTPWIEFDGQYSARCTKANGADVLLVTPMSGAPALVAYPNTAWGLHVDDPNLALGNLIGLVQSQARAWVVAH